MTKKPAKKAPAKKPKLSAGERAAMRETMRERSGPNGEKEMLAKIKEMPPADRAIAEEIRALVAEHAPDLSPRTWYGMPAWSKGDKVVCFFQNAAKFKVRYQTLGFSDKANLDDGVMWPTSYAVLELTPAEKTKIAALIKQAAS